MKSGAPRSRSERVAKYNRLLRIEHELGDQAQYLGASAYGRTVKPCTRKVDPATSTARAGLGRADTVDGSDLIAPISLASVRAYADLPSVDEAMEGRHTYRRSVGATLSSSRQRSSSSRRSRASALQSRGSPRAARRRS